MLVSLLWIVFVLVIVGIVLWGLNQMPIDPSIRQIIRVVIIVVAAVWVCYILFGLISSLPAPHPGRPLRP